VHPPLNQHLTSISDSVTVLCPQYVRKGPNQKIAWLQQGLRVRNGSRSGLAHLSCRARYRAYSAWHAREPESRNVAERPVDGYGTYGNRLRNFPLMAIAALPRSIARDAVKARRASRSPAPRDCPIFSSCPAARPDPLGQLDRGGFRLLVPSDPRLRRQTLADPRVQACDTCPLKRGGMHEDIPPAAIPDNEAEPLHGVVPLHRPHLLDARLQGPSV
jgi:hypothetical protein